MRPLSNEHFEFLRNFLDKNSGYQLSPGKDYLLTTYLQPVLEPMGFSDVTDLVVALQESARGPVADMVIESMTINETMFFRDNTPFQNIKNNILPALTKDQTPREIKVWCAACSSGQEPYSLAMLFDQEKHKYPGWRMSIMATDLSGEMVQRGQSGLYSKFEVERGLPEEYKNLYFTPAGDRWQISQAMRNMVNFQKGNLMQVPMTIGPFDIVMCRNVLLYFNTQQRKDVLSSIRRVTKNPGYLMVGSAEVLSDLTSSFKIHPEWRGIYQAV